MRQQQGSNVIQLPRQQEQRPQAVLKVVLQRVDAKVEFLLAGLLDNVADALFEEMTRLEDEEKLAQHFDVMRAVKQGTPTVNQEFQLQVDYLWRSLPTGIDDSRIPLPNGEAGSTIKQFANRTANHYKVLLQETSLRLQSLYTGVQSDHPLEPELYCSAYWHALGCLNLQYDERLMLLRLFNRFVMDRYGKVLAELNHTLIQLKVDVAFQTSTSSQ